MAEIKNVKLGDSQVNKIYSGSDLVFEANPVDVTAPITTVYQSGNLVWLEVNEACDTYFTLDGSTPTTASTKFTEVLTLNETTDIKYFSVDLAGNIETVKTTTVTIVSTPVTTISPSATVQNNIPITVTLTTSEQGAAIKYKIGSNATVFDYTAPFQVNQTTAGVLSTNITIKYWSVGANATEAEKSITYDTANAVPEAPIVTPTVNEADIALSWAATANTTSYTIYRSTVEGQLGSILAGTQYMSATNWTDATVEKGTIYYYTVQAGNYGRATNSAQVSGLIPVIPKTIANLIAWYDASELTLANDALVDTWDDLSGNNRHLTAAGADRPTFKTNILNGKPAIQFVQQMLQSSFGKTLTQPTTIIFVGKADDDAGVNRFFLDGSTGGRNGVYLSSVNKLILYAGGSILTDYTFPINAFSLVNINVNGAASNVRVKGAEVGTGNIGTQVISGLKVPSNISGTQRMNSTFTEILIYEKSLTIEEIGIIEDYLNDKYKLNNTWRYLKIQGYGANLAGQEATTRMVEFEAWEGATNRMSAATILSNDVVNAGNTDPNAIKDGVKTSTGYPLWWLATPNANVVVDLGAARNLTKLNYYGYSINGDQRQNRFKILASNTNNGTDWTTLWDMSANTIPQPILPSGYELIL